MRTACLLVLFLLALVGPHSAFAQPGSRILATSGATQLEGSAGGGIVPWAVISGYGSDTEIGGSAFYTRVSVDDFDLWSAGVAVGVNNRFELSVARQHLDVTPLDLSIEQDIFGAKYRVVGDLIYGALPQVSVGLMHKRNSDMTVPRLLGADSDNGTDVYVSASKLWLGAAGGYNVLLNGTLRHTEANQGGLLGFGSADGGRGELVVEGSAALFLNHNLAVGLEYRQKPNQLALKEQDWMDAFVGWFPNKRVAVVLAYAELGDIAGLQDQAGWYLSLQLTQ